MWSFCPCSRALNRSGKGLIAPKIGEYTIGSVSSNILKPDLKFIFLDKTALIVLYARVLNGMGK
jgi:hypothetical protein